MHVRRGGGRWRSIAIAAATAVVIGAATPSTTAAADPDEVEATEHLSEERGGSPNDYDLLYESDAPATTGFRAWIAKFLTPTGQVATVVRDESGATLDEAAFRSRVRAAIQALRPLEGKADAELRNRIASSRGAQSVPIGVWLDVDTAAAEAAVRERHPEIEWIDDRPTTDSLDVVRALRAELWDARQAAYAAAAAQLTPEVESLGGSVGYTSTAAPLMFVDLPADRADALAEHPAVSSLGLEREWAPAMAVAGPAVSADWTSGGGDQGTGIRVAVVEYANVRNTGDLAGKVVAAHSTTGTLTYTPSGAFDHPSWVAGAIAGGGSYRGVAPGALIVTAGTGGGGAGLTRDRAVVAAADWAISPSGGNADIVNVSLIQDTATGSEEARRYFDSLVDQDLRVAVASAGNFSAAGSWRVGSPGTSWNVLTVGGNDDRNTVSRGDDRHWYNPGGDGSSYVDPPSSAFNPNGDFNKPNVSAPAVGVRTANGMTGTGTSVAAPIVAGIAAQLMARQPSLSSWPEAVRALIMAGAVHHIRMPSGSYDADHEGVGSVSALWSNRILTTSDGTYGGYRYGLLTPNQAWSQTIAVRAGQTVKVVLTWNSRTGGSNNLNKSDTLAADLDLRVRMPNGNTVGSFTLDNSYEWVQFTAPTNGNATIEILSPRFDSSSETFAVAWAKWGGDQTPPAISSRAPEVGEPWASATMGVRATFNEPVTGVNGSSFTLAPAGGGAAVPASVSYYAPARRATLTPAAPLSPGAWRATLTSAIRDAAGNALPAQQWTFTVVASRGPSAAALSPQRHVDFAAGTHIGYQFDAQGRVIGSKSFNLGAASGASANSRAVIAHNPGRWLRIVNGVWAGYWIRESPRAHLNGSAESASFAPQARINFSAGTHRGYRFDLVDGSIDGSKTVTLSRASGASVSQRAVINGGWHLLVTNGVFAGYWIPETGVARLAGVADHIDLTGSGVSMSGGTHVGYRFTAAGAVQTTRSGSLGGGSGAPVGAWAVINGRPHVLVTAGTWAGYWIPESASAHVP